MISRRASDEELHGHPLFLAQKLRYLRFISRQAHDFGDHSLHSTAATYSQSTCRESALRQKPSHPYRDGPCAERSLRAQNVSSPVEELQNPQRRNMDGRPRKEQPLGGEGEQQRDAGAAVGHRIEQRMGYGATGPHQQATHAASPSARKTRSGRTASERTRDGRRSYRTGYPAHAW